MAYQLIGNYSDKEFHHKLTLTHCQDDHILTENIWFVWSETSYSGDKRRCHYAGRTMNDDDKQTTEDRASY